MTNMEDNYTSCVTPKGNFQERKVNLRKQTKGFGMIFLTKRFTEIRKRAS